LNSALSTTRTSVGGSGGVGGGTSLAECFALIGKIKQECADKIKETIDGMSADDDEQKKAADQAEITKMTGLIDQMTQIQNKLSETLSQEAMVKL
jgi:hypothetical protein